jgi:hypothetical protein
MHCSDPLKLYRVSAVWRLLSLLSPLVPGEPCVLSPYPLPWRFLAVLSLACASSALPTVAARCSFSFSVCLERPAPCGCPLDPSRVSQVCRATAVPCADSPRRAPHHSSLTLCQSTSEAPPAVGQVAPCPSPIAPRKQEALWEGGGNVGLASIDRNNKATLLFTAPYYTVKSYARVLFLRMVKLQDVS